MPTSILLFSSSQQLEVPQEFLISLACSNLYCLLGSLRRTYLTITLKKPLGDNVEDLLLPKKIFYPEAHAHKIPDHQEFHQQVPSMDLYFSQFNFLLLTYGIQKTHRARASHGFSRKAVCRDRNICIADLLSGSYVGLISYSWLYVYIQGKRLTQANCITLEYKEKPCLVFQALTSSKPKGLKIEPSQLPSLAV